MEKEEYSCPLYIRHIYTFYPAKGVLLAITQILIFEAITSHKEEQWHVEHVNPIVAIFRKTAMR